MGCVGSKLDDNEAVALCKYRSGLLSEAIRLRYGLADAHAGYMLSLRVVGDALEKFFDEQHRFASHPSPVLTLPTQRKGDSMPPLSPIPAPPPQSAAALPSSAGHHLSQSNSGSHQHLGPSDSDLSDEDDDGGHLHSLPSSPLPQKLAPKTYVNLAKKASAGPVVSYEIPPASPDVGYGYSYPTQGSDYGANPYSYPFASPYSGYGDTSSSFYGASSPPPSAAPSSSRQPPPPPSPPSVSTWDFLNLFESSYTNNYPSYTPSRSSKEVREEDGIPDLEEDDVEVIKEAIVAQKHVHTEVSPAAAAAEEKHQRHGSGGNSREIDPPVVAGAAPEAARAVMIEEIATRKLVPQSRGAVQAVQEIKKKFLGASESCGEISAVLEVGKRPYRRSSYGAVFPSMSLTSRSSVGKGDPDEDDAKDVTGLSSTLQKLFIWETKLYEEVRSEERMRLLHDQKLRLLKRLDDRGAESERISSTQAKVKKLATRIGVAIQVVDSISMKIGILRDEELWPQLNTLIQSFAKMWRALMECHRSQSEVVVESTSLDIAATAARGALAKELELSLLIWTERFCTWFNAQKKFAIALNAWLLKIIHQEEPEMTADGVAPFSPGRLGAPPVFVICNQWSQALESTTDTEVVEAMQVLCTSVFQLWDQRRLAEQPSAAAVAGAAGGEDQARVLRVWEKDEQAIQQARGQLNRKLGAMVNPRGVAIYREMPHPGHSLKSHSLHDSLQQVFDAMERLAESSVGIYDSLLVCCQSEQARISTNREDAEA